MKRFAGVTLVCLLALFVMLCHQRAVFFPSDREPAFSDAPIVASCPSRSRHSSSPKQGVALPPQESSSVVAKGHEPQSVDPARVALTIHPEFREYHALSVKSLLTQNERDRLGVLLSSLRQMGEAQATLIGDGVDELSEGDETARMMAVDYLMSAAAWDENPAREDVLRTIAAVIEADNIDVSLSLKLRRSRAGDKAELFINLLQRNPEIALEIERDVRDRQPLNNILPFARKRATASASVASDEISASRDFMGMPAADNAG